MSHLPEKIPTTNIFPVRKKKNTLKLANSLADDRNFNSMEKCIQFSKHSVFPALSCYFAFLGTNNATALHPTW